MDRVFNFGSGRENFAHSFDMKQNCPTESLKRGLNIYLGIGCTPQISWTCPNGQSFRKVIKSANYSVCYNKFDSLK